MSRFEAGQKVTLDLGHGATEEVIVEYLFQRGTREFARVKRANTLFETVEVARLSPKAIRPSGEAPRPATGGQTQALHPAPHRLEETIPRPGSGKASTNAIRCDFCGAEAAIGSRFCGFCGRSLLRPMDPRRVLEELAPLAKVAAGLILLFIVLAFILHEYTEVKEANSRALEYVEGHYEQSPAFYALTPDLLSGEWTVSSNFSDCFRESYHCADVRYSFNPTHGAEVKPVVCTWRVQVTGGKVTLAKPDNAEARELFQER